MSQHDTHCKRHKHRHKHNHPPEDKEKRQAALRLQDQCKLVNKIASIDIWATERLYKKWRRQALVQGSETHGSPQGGAEAERLTLHNYNASQQLCKRHGSSVGGGGKYFKASLSHPTGAKLITTTATMLDAGGGSRGGDTAPVQQRRAQSRPPDESRRKRAQHQHQNHQHRKHLSLSSDKNASHSHCQCQQTKRQQQQKKARQSERTSDIDWPDSWPSIWGSSAPKCVQHGSNDNSGRMATEEAEAANNATGCRDCRTEDKHHRHPTGEAASADRQRDKDSRRHRRSDSRPPSDEHRRCRTAAKHLGVSQRTVEALITLNSTELSSIRNGAPLYAKCDKHRINRRRDQSTDSRVQNRSQSSSSPKTCATRTRNKVSPSQQTSKTQQRLLDQSTYTIVRNEECSPKKQRQKQQPQSRKPGHDECQAETAAAAPTGGYNMARLSRSDRHPVEQVEQLPKPIVWLMTEDPTAEEVLSRQKDSSTMKSNVVVDNRTLTNATTAGATRRTVTNPTLRRLALREFAAATVACHNSLGGKSLQMLSTATNEREVDAQSSGPMCAALVSNVRPSERYKLATCHFPEIMMQSNATAYDAKKSSMLSDDLDDIIQTQQEMGESKGVEPKTGSVSRFVQDEVLKAAKLVAMMGFAGLVGTRRSDLVTDPNTTDTVGTVDDDDNEEFADDDEHDRDSLGELDDLDDLDDEGDDFDEDLDGEEDGEARTRQRRPTSRPRRMGKEADRRRKRSTSRQGGDNRARDNSRSARQKAASTKPLPMTQCPTTQHRIECYKTRSGRVKCYMTARHPVKCRVQGGRIVCKATVNAETSNLPYPCNAAWQ